MVPYSGSALSPSVTTIQHFRDLPEFSYLMSLNRSKWPRCLLWYGWLPGLTGNNGDPCATSFGVLADVALEIPEHPND